VVQGKVNCSLEYEVFRSHLKRPFDSDNVGAILRFTALSHQLIVLLELLRTFCSSVPSTVLSRAYLVTGSKSCSISSKTVAILPLL
jgi:hypothetical protein